MNAIEKQIFRKEITSLIIPIALQQLMLAVIGATDAVMLGLVDQGSMSSVSLAVMVQFLFGLIISAVVDGAGILIAQYWGKGDSEAIGRIVPMALKTALPLGVIFTLSTAIFPSFIMRIFTSDPELIEKGSAYLLAVSPSYLLYSVSQVYLSALKNTGNAKTSSRISSTAVAMNIVLNAILIFGLLGAPKLGIVGAAIATVISRLFELSMGFITSLKNDAIKIKRNNLFTKDKLLFGDFFKCFAKFFLAQFVWGLGSTMYSIIMGHLGSDAVAANSITDIVRTLLFCLCRGLGVGSSVLIGNILGAGDSEKAKRYGKRIANLSFYFGVGTGMLVGLISPIVVRLCPVSETAARYMQGMLVFCSFYTIARSINAVVITGMFLAGGDIIFDVVANAFAMWCFTIPLGFISAFVLKLPPLSVYCIVNMDEIIKVPAVFLYFRKYKWLNNLTRETA